MAVRVLFYNTFLLRVLPLPGGRWLHTKVAVEARAAEIGAALHQAYDVAALCEVFRPEERDALVAAAGPDDALQVATGPPASPPTALSSSGLATLVRHPLVRSAQHTYRTRGSRLRDVDAWANKGVLMVEVDVGLPGNLEVYSTHLFYGGDLLAAGTRHASPDLPHIRQAQVEELLAFVDATRAPGNVALILGDLNVDAFGKGPDGDVEESRVAAADLQQAMDDAGYDDTWSLAGDGPGWTCDLALVPPERFPADPAEPELCAEPAPEAQPGDRLVRIDYAFLQRPVPSHQVDVALQRARRRTFPRPVDAPDRDQIATMSDHVGLHLELDVAARHRAAHDPGSLVS